MISTVLLSKNSEETLESTLKSISFCSDIVVVDDFSVDQSVSIAERTGARVFKHKLIVFSESRNFGMSKARGDWILFIDDDEVVSEGLSAEILKRVQDDSSAGSGQELVNNVGYYIKRHEFWGGRELKYGEVAKARNQGFIRLVKKGMGQWQGGVHESLMAEGSVGRLENPLLHYPHSTITSFLSHINQFSDLKAEQTIAEDRPISIFQVVFYPIFKFIYTYVLLLGFLDGAPGFIYSFMMSFHSFLYRAKVMVHKLP